MINIFPFQNKISSMLICIHFSPNCASLTQDFSFKGFYPEQASKNRLWPLSLPSLNICELIYWISKETVLNILCNYQKKIQSYMLWNEEERLLCTWKKYNTKFLSIILLFLVDFWHWISQSRQKWSGILKKSSGCISLMHIQCKKKAKRSFF